MADGVLDFERSGPREGAGRDGSPVAVLLHGRGSHKGDLQILHGRLGKDVALVTPQAPHPGTQWGYGPGWAWYRYVEEDRVQKDTLDASLEALHAFLDELPEVVGYEPGAIFLGGFSQGGTTSVSYAIRHPGALTGVLVFSGFLPADGIVAATDVGETPVFWGHGTRDPNIPHRLAVRGRERLGDAGATVEARDYEIGHWIAPDEVEDAAAWIRQVRGG